MRAKPVFASICLVLTASFALAQTFDLRGVPVERLVVQNDLGSVSLGVSGDGRVHAAARMMSSADQVREEPVVRATREEGALILRVTTKTEGSVVRPIHLDLDVPQNASVTLWGRELDVVAHDVRGPLRVQSLNGRVRVEDVSGPTTLSVENGSIEYRSHVQPTGDVQLITDTGRIHATIDPSLHLKAQLQAGSVATWGSEAETTGGRITRELGDNGPLFHAASRTGRVDVSLEAAPAAVSGAAPSAPAAAAFKVFVDWVYLNVSARDALRDVSLSGLKKEDFLVYEDDALQPVGYFESGESPFHLLLLLDASESVRARLSLIRAAAIQFADQVRPGDRLAVATFNSKVQLVQEFTSSRPAIHGAINKLSLSGGTAVYDALLTSVTQYMAGIEGRKAVVLLSDGVDNSLFGSGSPFGSKSSFQDVLRSVQQSDTLIYSILVPTELPQSSGSGSATGVNPFSPGQRVGELLKTGQPARCSSEGGSSATFPCPSNLKEIYLKAEGELRSLAEQTGGRFYAPRRIEDLPNIYAQVAGDLKVQYTLGFSVRSEKQGWRQLKVRIRDQPLAVVRSRSGYLVPAR